MVYVTAWTCHCCGERDSHFENAVQMRAHLEEHRAKGDHVDMAVFFVDRELLLRGPGDMTDLELEAMADEFFSDDCRNEFCGVAIAKKALAFGSKKERAKIVAWLRDEGAVYAAGLPPAEAKWVADAIERGAGS